MNFPPFDPLRSYAEQLLMNPLAALRPPQGGIYTGYAGVSEAKHYGVVIDRQGPFQTELFIIPPEVKVIRSHVHPGVDSYEFHLSGDFIFEIEGTSYPSRNRGEPIGSTNVLQGVPANAAHGGTFTSGGSFLSFQFWRNGSPTSVTESFSED